MNTPVIKLSREQLESVYEPAEDSFLMIDALEADLNDIIKRKPNLCLEIGSGSGIIITALAMALKKYNLSQFFAVDINPNACNVTRETCAINSVDINVINMDLLKCIRSNCTFDIIIFNPPYVVTDSLEIFDENLIRKTWAGGANGREVMERIFPRIPNILSDKGLFYLLVIKENDPAYIINIFEKHNMIGNVVMERKIRGEHLFILRFMKSVA